MTEQEIAIITAIGDSLRDAPVSWDQIPEEQKAMVIAIMRPAPSFSPEQRSFLNHWWMQVDDAQLQAINNVLPQNNICEPRIDTNGGKWLSADLFTDAVEDASRLHNVLPLLLGLQLHYLDDAVWPVNESPYL